MACSRDIESSSTELEHTDYIFNCQPCAVDANNVQAVGYCVDCQEYLCQRCFDGHLIPSITRKHVLLDYEKIKDTTKAEIPVSSKRCIQHQDKIVEYHCPTHDFFGCHICFFKHQKGCKDVEHIPEIAKKVISSEEYKEFITILTRTATHCSDIVEVIKQKMGSVENEHMDAVNAIKTFAKETREAVDNWEVQMTDIAKTFKQEEITKMTAIYDKVNNILSENQKISSTMEMLESQQQHCDLYTTMVQTKKKLLSLKQEIQNAKVSMCRQKTTLHLSKADMDVLDMLKSQFSLKILHKSPEIETLEHISDINVNYNNYTEDCRIIGSVPLNDNKIVLTDESNNKVKLFDVSQNKIVSDLRLTSYPLGVCKVTDNQVAVALAGEKKLVLVRINPSLSIEREIGVNGDCRGVGYCDGKLVVSYCSPTKVEVLDLQGTVLKVIEKDHQGKSLFSEPYHLCINPDNKLMYVSNYYGNNLTCLKFDGTVVATYTDSELSYPWQVICDSSGKVYVCGRNSHNVHQVTEDCRKVKVLLTSDDGLRRPESICYCENAGRFYIGQHSDNIKEYRVVYESV